MSCVPQLESLWDTSQKGPSRVQQAHWLRKDAKSLGRPRQPEFLGQKTREKTAPRELWTSAQCMCVRKLPKAGKEPPRRIRGDGAHTGPGTVPVPRSQPGKPQDSGDTGKNRKKDLASVQGIISFILGTASDLAPNKSKKRDPKLFLSNLPVSHNKAQEYLQVTKIFSPQQDKIKTYQAFKEARKHPHPLRGLNQSIKTDLELTQMSEFADKNMQTILKTVFYMLKKLSRDK